VKILNLSSFLNKTKRKDSNRYLMSKEEIKQVIVIRTDLNMGKGKAVAQGCHGSVLATLRAIDKHKPWYDKWYKNGMKKVVCKIDNQKDLEEMYKVALDLDLPAAIINDAGHTQLPPGTTTSITIGPAPENRIDSITGQLKLL
jgi:peptidyl-tRNA hydrolase, PTH2 family